jgi:hypothetical protein
MLLHLKAILLGKVYSITVQANPIGAIVRNKQCHELVVAAL